MSDAPDRPERINDLAAVSIRLAGPDDIRGWSHGEVTHADFLKEPLDEPHAQGLFSERIFGALSDWCCGCRFQGRPRYWGEDHRGDRCPKCDVRIDPSIVRRRHMGHIDLAVPVVHTWFLRARPSPLALLLGMKASDLEQITSYRVYVVLDPKESGLAERQLLDDMEYLELRGQGRQFDADTGGSAIRTLLQHLKLDERAASIRAELEQLQARRVRAPRQSQLSQALDVVTWLQESGNRPEWMVLECLPVLPPDLRPMREIPGSKSRFSSDLNLFYENILRVNTRLRELTRRGAPTAVLRDQGQHLQRSVDELFDNARCKVPRMGKGLRPLRSLTDLIQGKQGRFRQNLLGKRVDYSGRGVIVVGPKLRLNQCGLPRAIAEELFGPYLLGRLARLLYYTLGMSWNAALRAAYMKIKGRDAKAREALRGALPQHRLLQAAKTLDSFDHLHACWLEEALRSHLVLLNRAPSLHRMNIQAFQPVLCDGKTIRLHPLVCEGFNADFDGDTMAVHLPLSAVAQEEAARLMRPVFNLLSPANGRPLVPSNEIVLGCYYLTADVERMPIACLHCTPAELILAHSLGKLLVHDAVRVRLPEAREIVRAEGCDAPCRTVMTTAGRVLFNDILPAGMPYYDLPVSRKVLAGIVSECFRLHGKEKTADLLDAVKDLGLAIATRSGLSFIVEDLLVPSNKEEVIRRTQCQVDEVRRRAEKGELSDDQRYEETIRLWQLAQEEVAARLIEEMKHDQRPSGGRMVPYLNPLYLMAHSGARSKWEQIRQLCAMRGLMARPSGSRRIVELPITSSLRQGLSVHEYWISTHGARKAGADKDALPDSGYLTRKLVDVAHHIVINVEDCGTTAGRHAPVSSCRGRVSLDEVRDSAGKRLLGKYELIARPALWDLKQAGIDEVVIRSPLTCRSPRGVCRQCYGIDLATDQLVELGTPAGILAAQSIGEPGTQLAMNTKHTGGVVTARDMVSGLKEIEALFEARTPRRPAVLAEVTGEVRLRQAPGGEIRVFIRPSGEEDPWAHGPVPARRLRVKEGEKVSKGDPLTDGSPWPDELLRLRGIDAVRQHLLDECQSIYRGNGVTIDDKHFEVIVARIVARWRIDTPGDTGLLPGAIVTWQALVEANQRLIGRVRITHAGSTSCSRGVLVEEREFKQQRQAQAASGKVPPLGVSATPATATPLGITRAALEVESFLSAASFQKASQVLMEAALAGRVDPLSGLKENVLLGRLIPAGTGFRAADCNGSAPSDVATDRNDHSERGCAPPGPD